MIIQYHRSDIQSEADLHGRVIATRENTVSETICSDLGLQVHAVPESEDAYWLLDEGLVEAVVYDAPVLLHYANANSMVTVLPRTFRNHYYGFACPEGSELIEHINRALLQIREEGEYQRLYDKWFGK